MRDSTIIMLLTVILSLGFRYLKNNGLGQNNQKYDDDFLPEVYVPVQTQPKSLNEASGLEKSSKLIEKYPTDASAYGDRGAIYVRLKRYDEALIDLNKAVELQPTYADALNNRGVVYYHKAVFEQAINDFTSALSHVSEDGAYYLNRGMTYKKISDHLKAGADFDRALELDRRFIDHAYKVTLQEKIMPEDRFVGKEQARIVFFRAEILFVKYQRATYSDEIPAV